MPLPQCHLTRTMQSLLGEQKQLFEKSRAPVVLNPGVLTTPSANHRDIWVYFYHYAIGP